jgi:hypothetical protein
MTKDIAKEICLQLVDEECIDSAEIVENSVVNSLVQEICLE